MGDFQESSSKNTQSLSKNIQSINVTKFGQQYFLDRGGKRLQRSVSDLVVERRKTEEDDEEESPFSDAR